jgi:hypothetical protein
MLQPSKHSHPDETVLAAATTVLRELKESRAASFDELKRSLALHSRGSDYLFTPAISLLFLLGLAEYRSTTDSFEYTGTSASQSPVLESAGPLRSDRFQ